ncbi:PAAR domain-containing protein [Morganella psychrotolerans]|uniref:PAAR domain-containing protein n=1 Tax=Morganella psychrotolerans TaxID=368603 RepID=UPI0039AF5A5F
MLPAARMGDVACHGGCVEAGSCNVTTNNIPQTFIGAPVCCSIHVKCCISSASCSVFVNNIPAARAGDCGGCGTVISSGSCNVFIGH